MKLTYLEALQLDNFLQVLTAEQRMATHQYHAHRRENVPKMVQLLQDWIERNEYEIPEFRISQEREVLWVDNGIARSLHTHPLYKVTITFLKE